jgi:putative membrane protein
MYWIIQLLLNAAVLMLLAAIMKSVEIRTYGTAIGVALLVGLLNATIGFLLRLPLNILTLGLLSFVVRLVVMALMIRIADLFFRGFVVRTFTAALILACGLALAATVLEFVI